MKGITGCLTKIGVVFAIELKIFNITLTSS